jgi:hypothetical protein
MNRLRDALGRIDKGEGAGAPPAEVPIVTETRGGYVAEMGGQRRQVTLGELLTDGEWGLDYALHAAMPRAVKRRYVLEMAKRELRELLDKQILHHEIGRAPEGKHLFKSMLAGTLQERPGNVAEKMVRNFLKKAAIDLGMEFEIIEADVHQDTIQKIDFIIHRTNHNRGTRVETGVQFTTSTSSETLKDKRQQIAEARKRTKKTCEVDDIILVTLPLSYTMELVERWKSTGLPGGPDAMWERSQKAEVLRRVLEGVVPDDEIEAGVAKL